MRKVRMRVRTARYIWFMRQARLPCQILLWSRELGISQFRVASDLCFSGGSTPSCGLFSFVDLNLCSQFSHCLSFLPPVLSCL